MDERELQYLRQEMTAAIRDSLDGVLMLTKREEFAKAAMVGLLAQSPAAKSAQIFAREAVIMADAMIDALEKTP